MLLIIFGLLVSLSIANLKTCTNNIDILKLDLQNLELPSSIANTRINPLLSESTQFKNSKSGSVLPKIDSLISLVNNWTSLSSKPDATLFG